MWNESTSSIQVYIQQWFHDEQRANFIVTRNKFRHVLICWCVTLFLRVSYWGHVVEMTFSSIYFAKLFKIDSFSASRVIYNEDALLMIYYHTGIYLSE